MPIIEKFRVSYRIKILYYNLENRSTFMVWLGEPAREPGASRASLARSPDGRAAPARRVATPPRPRGLTFRVIGWLANRKQDHRVR
jgi:hypothetical protein